MSEWLEGGCHCGAVRFRVRVEERRAINCNCSVCTKKGYLHVIVEQDGFEQTAGADALATYTFGTHTAKHFFCRTCGMHPFYVPRSHPAGIDVNVRCLDEGPAGWAIEPFDGQEWESNVGAIR